MIRDLADKLARLPPAKQLELLDAWEHDYVRGDPVMQALADNVRRNIQALIDASAAASPTPRPSSSR